MNALLEHQFPDVVYGEDACHSALQIDHREVNLRGIRHDLDEFFGEAFSPQLPQPAAGLTTSSTCILSNRPRGEFGHMGRRGQPGGRPAFHTG